MIIAKIQTILFFFFSSLYISAQVTIGASEAPLGGALLQLKNKPDRQGANADKGLLLPRVSLKSKTGDLAATMGLEEGLYGTDASSHAGLVVYAVDKFELTNCPGVYVWDGQEWQWLGWESDTAGYSDLDGCITPQSAVSNFYGIITTNLNTALNLKYARQMGYEYVLFRSGWQSGLESGDTFRFLLFNPESFSYEKYGDAKDISQSIINRHELDSIAKKDPATYAQIAYRFSTMMALKDNSLPFPENLARGWFQKNGRFRAVYDLQQQRVIDYIVDKVLQKAQQEHHPEMGYHFAGIAIDVPQLTGDFWDTIPNISATQGKQRTLAFWTGGDYGSKHPDVTHDYPTYSDGCAAFYKTLIARAKEVFSEARLVVGPYNFYEDYIKQIEDREDARQLIPDLMLQESSVNRYDFVNDTRAYQKGLISDYSSVGSAATHMPGESENRTVAGLAASKGATFGFFGSFGNYNNITEVPQRIKLVRAITVWENGNNTPRELRQWDGNCYSSPTAFISDEVIWGIQPKTNRLFLVFLKSDAVAQIPKNFATADVWATDNYFIETTPANSALTSSPDGLRLVNASDMEQGFILKH